MTQVIWLFYLLSGSPWPSVGYPPPFGGYFGRKILAFNDLQRVSVCKIFITNGLQLKYLLSISYPGRVSRGLFVFFDLYISIAVVVELVGQADVVGW
jgi:hypothetical protein